jgi:hypothetical protein
MKRNYDEHKQEIPATNPFTVIMSNMITQTQPSTEVDDQIEDDMISTMVAQTQPSTDGKIQNEDVMVTEIRKGKTEKPGTKLSLPSKVFGKKPMIQLTLEGGKAIIKQNQKTITVKRHYRNTRTTDIKLKIKEGCKKPRRKNDDDYQLSLKLINKIRFDELMQLRNRAFISKQEM